MLQAGLSGQKNSKESSYALNKISTFFLLIKIKPWDDSLADINWDYCA